MTPFAAIVGGGAAGFFGAALAHILATWGHRLGAENWLRGEYAPPFVPLALYTAAFYGAIGAAAGRNPKTAAVGFCGPLLAIALPMAVLARGAHWDGTRWQFVITLIYTAAIWGSIAAMGALNTAPRWRGALAAILGSFAAYAVLTFFLWAAPSYAETPWNPLSFLPSPVNLMDGLLSGAGLCLALSLDAKLWRNAHES